MPTVSKVLLRIAHLARLLVLGATLVIALMLSSPLVLALIRDGAAAPTAHQLARGESLEYQPATREQDGVRERFRPDGECSVPAALPVPFDLRSACQVHDLAYDELRVARESGAHGALTTRLARWSADVDFVLRGHRQCRSVPRLEQHWCHGAVAVMGTAVTLNSIRQGYGATPQESPAALAAWAGGLVALVGAPRRTRPGRHEREFLSAFTRTGAVGIYLGLRHARTLRERLERLREELHGSMATGDVVLVVTTGSGWINPYAITGLQAAARGPVTVIAFQYSRMPSWAVTMFRHRLPARAARSALSVAADVAAAIRVQGGRSRLLVHGESLGAAGIRTAFAQLPHLAACVDGGVLVSPPGSVEWAAPASIEVVRHRDDAVVWFTPRLLVRPLRWRCAAGDGTPAAPPYRTPWRPVWSFLQVLAALPSAGDLPYGHGHRYGPELTQAWARTMARSAHADRTVRTAG